MQNLAPQPQNRANRDGAREGYPVKREEADVSACEQGGVGEAELRGRDVRRKVRFFSAKTLEDEKGVVERRFRLD
jgi:hypothetical protein